MNDLVVCVSVTPRSTEDFSGNERLTLKWTYPVSDIEVCRRKVLQHNCYNSCAILKSIIRKLIKHFLKKYEVY